MRLADFAVDADVEILGLLDEQQLIEAVAKHVLLARGQLFVQRRADDAVLAHFGDELAPAFFEVAARDDVAIALGDDLFDGDEFGRRERADDEGREGEHEFHTSIIY